MLAHHESLTNIKEHEHFIIEFSDRPARLGLVQRHCRTDRRVVSRRAEVETLRARLRAHFSSQSLQTCMLEFAALLSSNFTVRASIHACTSTCMRCDLRSLNAMRCDGVRSSATQTQVRAHKCTCNCRRKASKVNAGRSSSQFSTSPFRPSECGVRRRVTRMGLASFFCIGSHEISGQALHLRTHPDPREAMFATPPRVYVPCMSKACWPHPCAAKQSGFGSLTCAHSFEHASPHAPLASILADSVGNHNVASSVCDCDSGHKQHHDGDPG